MNSLSKAAIFAISVAVIACQNEARAEKEGRVSDAQTPADGSVVPTSALSSKKAVAPAPTPPVAANEQIYAHPYEFTSDWFTADVPLWNKLLEQFKGKPNLNYLEVGVFEGRSFFWMLDNVLTDPTCQAIAVDLFFEPWDSIFESNLRLSGARSRVTVMKGDSQDALKTLKKRVFDIVYIDASHTARDTMFDALLAWDLLKPTGLLIFDDYGNAASETPEGKAKLPDELRPAPAIDAFITLHRNELKVVHRGYQVAIMRVQDPCSALPYDDGTQFDPNLCTAVGNRLYNWQTRKFVGDGAPVLSMADRVLLETFLRSPELGRAAPPKDVLESPKLATLFERMNVTPESRELGQ